MSKLTIVANVHVNSDQIDLVKAELEKLVPQNSGDLSSIARSMNITPKLIQRTLQEAGTSFNRFIDNFRMEKSINLLNQGDYKVNEIGDLVGFSESSAFYRAFKRWTSLTPMQYQEKQLV